MGSCRTLNIIGAATLLVSLCAVAAYAAPAATAADMPATPPNAENQPITNSSNTVTITAPRPLTQTPGVLSLDGLSLTSPLAVTDAPSQPLVPNSYFGGGGGMYPSPSQPVGTVKVPAPPVGPYEQAPTAKPPEAGAVPGMKETPMGNVIIAGPTLQPVNELHPSV